MEKTQRKLAFTLAKIKNSDGCCVMVTEPSPVSEDNEPTKSTDCMRTYTNKKIFRLVKAFTLAEVLITLGIIGVVAALTIPTLMQNTKNKQYISGFQKAWGLLSNAVEMSEAHNGFATTWDEPTGALDEEYIKKYWLPYFNIIKDCGFETGKGCMPKESFRPNGIAGAHNDYLAQYKIMLSDGSSMNIFPYKLRGDVKCVQIVVDTNGPKMPNMYGKDIFWFEFNPKKQKVFPFVDAENIEDIPFEDLKENCTNGSGSLCGAYLVRNGYKMDY